MEASGIKGLTFPGCAIFQRKLIGAKSVETPFSQKFVFVLERGDLRIVAFVASTPEEAERLSLDHDFLHPMMDRVHQGRPLFEGSTRDFLDLSVRIATQEEIDFWHTQTQAAIRRGELQADAPQAVVYFRVFEKSEPITGSSSLIG
jgi:hypothetical protein